MSATTFLLILAAVIIVFVGFVVRSWFEIANVKRIRPRHKDANGDEDENEEEM